VIYSITIYANTNIKNTLNSLKIVTMQPIADDPSDINQDDTFNKVAHVDITKQSNSPSPTISIIDEYLNEGIDDAPKKNHTEKTKQFSAQELKCLTQIIYFEAKSEGYKGGVAVGSVIMNRVNNRKFPNTICGVMNQKYHNMCQFSFVCNGQINQAVNTHQWNESEKIALDIINGVAPKISNGALFFHSKYSKLRLASNRYTAKIGNHYFYK
jgi:spore germination cell wall hydrolase CwlJ-like protein